MAHSDCSKVQKPRDGDGRGEETFRNDSTGFSFLVARSICDFLRFSFWLVSFQGDDDVDSLRLAQGRIRVKGSC